MAIDPKLGGIYLNDHLAGSTVGRELAKRAAGSNEGTELGAFLRDLVEQIVEDRDTLRDVMRRLELREDPVKRAVALVGERAGRLKLNGSLRSYSPLSRVVELEGLALGVTGKLALWRALAEVDDPRLAEFDFAALAERAKAQQAGLEEHRLAAAREALAR